MFSSIRFESRTCNPAMRVIRFLGREFFSFPEAQEVPSKEAAYASLGPRRNPPKPKISLKNSVFNRFNPAG